MKIKPLVPKKLKYKPIAAKPLKYLKIAVDKDGDGIPQFLDCNDHSAKESGVLHDWINKQRLLQEMKHMAKLDIKPTESEQEYFNEGLSKSETSIENFKTKVEDRTGYWKENIQEGLEVRKLGKSGKQKSIIQKTPVLQHPTQEGEKAVFYLIPPPRKMFVDENGQRCSIPHSKRDKYVPFSPPSVGRGLYKPKTISSPYMEKKRRERELARLYIRLKVREVVN